MGLKTITTRTYGQYDVATCQASLNHLITTLANVGVVRTADTGQIDIAALTLPSSAVADKGYLIFRVFSDVVLRLDIIINKGAAATSGWIKYKPSIGALTDGAGNISGSKLTYDTFGMFNTENQGETIKNSTWATAYNMNTSLYTSYAYRNDDCFWCMIDVDRLVNGQNAPSLNIMISKQLDRNNNVMPNRVNVIANDYPTTSASSLGWQTAYTCKFGAFSNTEVNALNEDYKVPILTSRSIDNSFNVYCRKIYNPVISNTSYTNDNIFMAPTTVINFMQEFKINIYGIDKNFISLQYISSGPPTFKITTDTSNFFPILIWD